MAKKSGKKNGKKARKASAKSDRELLELGEELLTAVHLHHAVQDDEVRAALAASHPDLFQACGDLVARMASRFLEDSGAEPRARDRYARWTQEAAGGSVEVTVPETPAEEAPSTSH